MPGSSLILKSVQEGQKTWEIEQKKTREKKMRAFVAILSAVLAAAAASAEDAPAALAEGVAPADQATSDSSVHYAYGREYG